MRSCLAGSNDGRPGTASVPGRTRSSGSVTKTRSRDACPLLLNKNNKILSKPMHIAPFLTKSNKDLFPKRSHNMIPHCGFP